MKPIAVRPVSVSEIISDKNMPAIIAEYSKECRILELGEVSPQLDQYALLEQSGKFQAFGVYDDSLMVGFSTVITTLLPHYGNKAAISDFIFLLPSYRSQSEKLFECLESYASEKECFSFIYSAPVGSRFDRVMKLKKRHYIPTHNEYMVVLQREESHGN